jgi:hypothetical protein
MGKMGAHKKMLMLFGGKQRFRGGVLLRYAVLSPHTDYHVPVNI